MFSWLLVNLQHMLLPCLFLLLPILSIFVHICDKWLMFRHYVNILHSFNHTAKQKYQLIWYIGLQFWWKNFMSCFSSGSWDVFSGEYGWRKEWWHCRSIWSNLQCTLAKRSRSPFCSFRGAWCLTGVWPSFSSIYSENICAWVSLSMATLLSYLPFPVQHAKFLPMLGLRETEAKNREGRESYMRILKLMQFLPPLPSVFSIDRHHPFCLFLSAIH